MVTPCSPYYATGFLDKHGQPNHQSASDNFSDTTKQWTALADSMVIAMLEAILPQKEVEPILDKFRHTPDPQPAYFKQVVSAVKREQWLSKYF